MKRYRTIGLILLVAVAALLVWNFGFRKKEATVVVQTEKPQYGHIAKTVTATGTLQPVDTVAVGTQVSGTIKNVYADFNSSVKKGQLLAEIDKSLLQATVSQFAANLAEMQSSAAYQRSNFNRQKELYGVGAISKADYEIALNQYNTANASVKSVQAQLQSAQKNLSYTNIYSPIDGVVLSRNISSGQTVAASFSTPTLFSIAKDITRMQVQAKVDEADIGNVKKGQRATFTVDAFLNDEFSGTVEEIRLSPSVSSNVVTYTTLISAANEEQKLKPGMTATITIFTEEENKALLIPAKALKFAPDSSLSKQYQIVPYNKPEQNNQTASLSGGAPAEAESFVWVKTGNTLTQRKIKTGLNDNTQVQVLEGLTENEEVLTGTETTTEAAPANDGAQSSPFMPTRPGGSNKKNSNPGPPPQ